MTRIHVRANTGQYLQLAVMDCATCGLVFAVDSTYDQRRRSDGASFKCPNGHILSYNETEADRLRKEKERLNARLIAQMDQAHAAQREAAEAKASEIRLRWRVGNGVCPCCQRTFPGLASHVAQKHPEFLTHDLSRLSNRQVELLATLRRVTEDENTAIIDAFAHGLDYRSVRALERRGLLQTIHAGRIALTEQAWPLAEQAASRVTP